MDRRELSAIWSEPNANWICMEMAAGAAGAGAGAASGIAVAWDDAPGRSARVRTPEVASSPPPALSWSMIWLTEGVSVPKLPDWAYPGCGIARAAAQARAAAARGPEGKARGRTEVFMARTPGGRWAGGCHSVRKSPVRIDMPSGLSRRARTWRSQRRDGRRHRPSALSPRAPGLRRLRIQLPRILATCSDYPRRLCCCSCAGWPSYGWPRHWPRPGRPT